MQHLEAAPDAIRRLGDTAEAVSQRLTAAAGFDLERNLAAMTAALGPIGAQYLAAFAVAQSNHAEGYARLAGHYAAAAGAARATAAGYEHVDSAAADGIAAAAGRPGA
jgi:hypothetical protein